MTTSVYARALGDRFGMLHPELRRWFDSTTSVSGHGVFSEVGPRHRWLRPAFAAASRIGLLFAEQGRDVPFDVTMSPAGGNTVATRRVLHFATGSRVISDTTRVARGRLIDAHARGRLKVEMTPDVVDGALIVVSARARFMLGRCPCPVPSPRVQLRHAWDETREVHTIDVSVRVPVLGEVFGYRGHFVGPHA
ncbi:DUF4166 domain-containing protein [Homoserinimonas hongtaonis]|uniref:DUF4166 domain-containing protein n=1 Tax=Homoserinimonas hongtaonis TaxID=2079791 RepID=A0A2U1T2V9_9MICO|nr:DUF4166 domain-containing protein [Salinibacterium hongtaonis]PWB98103.1 hypothetical protein DF220_09895 [Salinibacterium hongtaonis]